MVLLHQELYASPIHCKPNQQPHIFLYDIKAHVHLHKCLTNRQRNSSF